MKTLTLNIPDSVELNEQEAKSMLAAGLYEKGSLSLGQAAELAGCTKQVFMQSLASYGVSLFNYSEADIENELNHAKNYHLRH